MLLYCIVLFCFVLFCFVLFCFVLVEVEVVVAVVFVFFFNSLITLFTHCVLEITLRYPLWITFGCPACG